MTRKATLEANQAARTAMTGAADDIKELLERHEQAMAELQKLEAALRAGDLASALVHNNAMGELMLAGARVNMRAGMKLASVTMLDPPFWEATQGELQRREEDAAAERLAVLVEEWTADECREAIEEHTKECTHGPGCRVLPIYEERLARHEPN